MEAPEASPAAEAGPNFSKSRGQLLIVEGVRVAFLVAILGVTVAFQATQPAFVNVDVLLPAYLLLAIQFLVNAVYLFRFETASKGWRGTSFLFASETIFISALIYFTGINQSIFLFLYLVNIILAGFVFQRRGAILVALGTSLAFSLLVVLGPEVKGQTLFFAIVLNNMAFLAVAGLSGFLSEQLNFMGSELKARGRSLAALQSLNELIVRDMASGLITVDNTGTAILANGAAREILSAEGKIEGRPLDAILPGMLERILGADFIGLERSSERFDWSYRAPGGEKLTLDATVSRLLDLEGKPTGFVMTFQDLTKVRRLEFAMRQSEKLAAVGQLAAGIAHEIRNPLASISGSIQLLESALPAAKDAEERKLMRIVLKEIDRLNGLVSEFLAYVRPDQPKDDPIDLAALTRETLDLAKLNKGIRQDVRIDAELDTKDAIISGDRDKLKQALLNVVLNAYQSMDQSDQPVIEASAIRVGSSVQLKVRDRGVGIEEARLRKIFEPFHTTKPKGTGLGLAVTHKIIENHGGKIYVESAKGSGTEFTFEFPARGTSSGPSSNGQGTGPDVGQNGLAVLTRGADDLNLNRKKRGSG